ncbi:MAG: aminoacyl-tRNA hydrolase [Solirubrobacterales bacterium]
MRPFGRRKADGGAQTASVDSLIVGLGNPGDRYAGTRHNIGFEVADALSSRWQLPRAKQKFGGQITDGRIAPGGPRVAILLPQTFMNQSGSAAGPARGSFGLPLDRVIAIHDEIDLPFGEIRTKLGGGVAGHNGLKSLDRGLGSRDFWRLRVGVGRPEGTDPELVSRYVLGRFSEEREQVGELIERAVEETERLLERITGEQAGEEQEEPSL